MLRRLAVVSLVLVAAAACSDDPMISDTGDNGAGQLTVLNALGQDDNANIRLDGTLLTLPPAGQSITAVITAGAHELQALDGAQVTAVVGFSMLDGKHRTAVLGGGSGHSVLLVSPIDTAALPIRDEVKVRIVHAAPDAPIVNVDLFDARFEPDSSARFITNLLPPGIGINPNPPFPGFGIRPPGSYDVVFRSTATGEVIMQGGPYQLSAGHVYSIVLVESGTGTLELQVVREH